MMINRQNGMRGASSSLPPSPPAGDHNASGLVPQLRMMLEALWISPLRNRLLLLVGALFAVIAATAYGQIRLNDWNKPFYDALAHRNFEQFLQQLGVFGLIAGVLLVLNVAQRWLGETAKVSLREGLVQDLIGHWMQPGRAYQLAHAGSIGVNPDQRLHEDARHLTELSADLGIGLLQASILLAMFVRVLWSISADFALPIGSREVAIPGYMVWAAVAYAGAASLLSYWVGANLVERNADHYAREADLRYSLVRINDHIDAISLAAGEADERRRIEIDLQAVLLAMRRLVTGITNLTWVTAGSGWFTLIAPILAAAPLYFAGRITFGGLMLASGAFMQVQSSLRWFVDNFSAIADWRATLLRVAAFRRALLDADTVEGQQTRIGIAQGPAGGIRFEDLEIDYPSGRTRLAEGRVAITDGERVLILGESGSGKTLLFRSLAGLWRWGRGTITLPQGEEILFLPRTPYLPPGELRAALAYPLTTHRYADGEFIGALQRVGLERLTPLLDSVQRWDRVLPERDRQRFAFARALLRRPAWIVVDDLLDALDAPTLQKVQDILASNLRQSGVICIGGSEGIDHLFTRVLHLIKSP